jgi:hypothetical protein
MRPAAATAADGAVEITAMPLHPGRPPDLPDSLRQKRHSRWEKEGGRSRRGEVVATVARCSFTTLRPEEARHWASHSVRPPEESMQVSRRSR